MIGEKEIGMANTKMTRSRKLRIRILPKVDLIREKTAPWIETKTTTEKMAVTTKISSGREAENTKEKTGRSEMLKPEEEGKMHVMIIKKRTSPQKITD